MRRAPLCGASVMSGLLGDTHSINRAPPAFMPQVQAGKMTLLAVSTARRLPQLPKVRRCANRASRWTRVVAPAGISAPALAKLNQAYVGAMRDAAVLTKLRARSTEPEPGAPEQFAASMRSERDKWGPVIKRAGIKAD